MNDPLSRPGPDPDIAGILARETGGKPWYRRGRALATLAAAVLIVGGAVAYWATSGGDAKVRYVTEPAAKGDLTVIVTATGSVQPTNKVDVSSELSGIIREVLVDFNSPVKKGQPLAMLDTDRLKATADSSRARVAAAEAHIREADATAEEKRLDYQRKKGLVERQVTSARDMEAARAAYDRAIATQASVRAELGAAEADLKLNETNLAKACICSPIDGVVLSRKAEPGQTVASSLQAPVLFTLAEDLREMEVQVDVDEADVGKVTTGQSATFTVDAYPDRKFAARIKELYLGSEVIQGVVTYKAILATENNDLALRPGMTATAEITVAEVKDVLTVPNAALRFQPPAAERGKKSGGILDSLFPGRISFRAPSKQQTGGKRQTVWTLADGQPAAVSVTVGATDGKRTQIAKGKLEADTPVIIDAQKSGK